MPLVSLEEERRKRTVHLEGRGRTQNQPQQQNNWSRIQELTNRIEGGGVRSNGTNGGGSSGGAGGAGGASGGGGSGAMIIDGGEETAFTPPVDGQRTAEDAQDPQQQQPGLKIWTTHQMYNDEETKRDFDVKELLRRLREEAIKDQSKAADFLREHPELASMLIKAVPDPAAAKGWKMDGGDQPGGPMSDGAGGFFI